MHTNYHPVFQFPHLRKEIAEDDQFLSTYITQIEKAAATDTVKKKIFSLIPDKAIYSLFTSSVDILFFAPSFSDLIKTQNIYSIKILGGLSFKDCNYKPTSTSTFPIFFFSLKIMNLYYADPQLNSTRAEQLIKDTATWMRKCHFKYIVVQNDSLFIERFLILCAKKATIPSICIQHGIFSKKTSKELMEGKTTDFFFAWDEQQAHIIRTCSNTSVKILGYPHNIVINKKISTSNKKNICILGQPYENYNLYLGEKKKELFTRLIDLLEGQFGIVVYKPHPGEKDIRYIPDEVELFAGSLADAIEQFDVFISISSTALLEATLANKIAIQIYDKSFNGDNLQEAGYSYSIESKKMNQIAPYISSLESSFLPFCTMPVYENISQRFIDLLDELQ